MGVDRGFALDFEMEGHLYGVGQSSSDSPAGASHVPHIVPVQ